MSVAGADRRLYFPNGTRMIFNNSGQCLEIQDRNGNLMIAEYAAPGGNLSKVTDTLGREINFTYNAYFQISDITQSRRDENNAVVTVTLAHFGYQDFFVKTNFSGVASNIPQNSLLPLLKTVQLASGSVYSFEYNSYVQVRLINHYAPLTTTSNPNNLSTDYRMVSATSYNFPSVTTPGINTPQTDCPRFTKRFDEAADWASGVTTNYLRSGNYGEVTAPNGTKTREYYQLATSNPESWLDGLIFKTELSDVNTATIKRTTLTTWNGGGSTTWGPRVVNATVTDNENNSSRYSEYEYGSYNLPVTSKTWKVVGSAMTMLQQTTTSYLLSSTYITGPNPSTTRWIAGLPADDIALSHENDLEGCLVVVEKRGANFADAVVAYVETMAHNRFYKYRTSNARSNVGEMIDLQDQHPLIFSEPKGHGVFSSSGSQAQLKKSMRGTLIYEPKSTADDADEVQGKLLSYDLISMQETLWKRAEGGTNETFGEEFDYGKITVTGVKSNGKESKIETKIGKIGTNFLGKEGFKNKARAPWAWYDSLESERSAGEWFFNPAGVVARHFGLDKTFSQTYVYHSFLKAM